MARIKRAVMTRKRRNKVLKCAKGYWGAKSKHFKMAKQAVMKSGNYAFTGRKLKKRDFRRLWITRISAQAKVCGMNYSTMMHGLKLAGIDLNRKMLAELAVSDKDASQHLLKRRKQLFNVSLYIRSADVTNIERPGTRLRMYARVHPRVFRVNWRICGKV